MWGAVSDGSPIALEAEISWRKNRNFKGGPQVYGEIAPYLRRVGAKNGFSRISAENRQEIVTKTLLTYAERRDEHVDMRFA